MPSTPDLRSSVGTSVPDPMTHEFLSIRRIRKETRDTFTLDLGRNGVEHSTMSFAPGQFNMVYVTGIGEVPVSISGNPAETNSLVHTVRAVGAVTRAMTKMKAGEPLGIRGPFGAGWPVRQAEGHDVVIVAGGIGLAPLRPVVYHILGNREKYAKVALLYGSRSPEDLLYQRELERWRSRFDLDVQITVDRAAMQWRGNVGVVTTLIAKGLFDPGKTVAMVCGPELMMRFTTQEFIRKGLPLNSIYVSMERNMKCGIGLCGHCQYGPTFICKDGPVFAYDRIKQLFNLREL